jgi:hypothetical protein
MMGKMMGNGLSDLLRYKVRRRSLVGNDERWEILGPRGWIAEGEANDNFLTGLISAARQLSDLFRNRNNPLPTIEEGALVHRHSARQGADGSSSPMM